MFYKDSVYDTTYKWNRYYKQKNVLFDCRKRARDKEEEEEEKKTVKLYEKNHQINIRVISFFLSWNAFCQQTIEFFSLISAFISYSY